MRVIKLYIFCSNWFLIIYPSDWDTLAVYLRNKPRIRLRNYLTITIRHCVTYLLTGLAHTAYTSHQWRSQPKKKWEGAEQVFFVDEQ